MSMDEAQWLASESPAAMLHHLQDGSRHDHATGQTQRFYSVSERKLRLLACACCRQAWSQLTDRRSRSAVEVAERFADGDATAMDLHRHRAWSAAIGYASGWSSTVEGYQSLTVADYLFATAAVDCCRRDSGGLRWLCGEVERLKPPSLTPAMMASLFREIVGNPFRPATLGIQPSDKLTPQEMLAVLLDVQETNSLGGMSVYKAGRGRKISDRQLAALAAALQRTFDQERGIDIARDNLTITHWHTGNGHYSSSFQLQATEPVPPGEPVAWQIHLKNTVAAPLIKQVAGELLRPSWLTPTVRSLAEMAYQERSTRPCERCGGAKGYWPGNLRIGELTDSNWQRCSDCGSTGTFSTGTLDPDRLLVLADCLEEAGADPAGELVMHLRGYESVPAPCYVVIPATMTHDPEVIGYQIRWSEPDEQSRYQWVGHYFAGPSNSLAWCQNAAERDCERRNRGRQMVKWVKTDLPHYRGCWVLDLLLGKN